MEIICQKIPEPSLHTIPFSRRNQHLPPCSLCEEAVDHYPGLSRLNKEASCAPRLAL